MSDERHKQTPPPDEIEEDVTNAFRKQVRDVLVVNEASNKARGLRRGDLGYLISNQAELADEIDCDKNLMRKFLGPVKGEPRDKLLNRSTYVGKIRKALGFPPLTQISVPMNRASVLKAMSEMPDALFKQLEDAIMRAHKKLG
jgi:hypothetical protein